MTILIELKGAKSILREISLDHKNFKNVMGKYIFRGQGEALWEAMPSVFRKDAKIFSGNELFDLGVRTNRDQIYAEWDMILTLVHELNMAGLHVPDERLLRIYGGVGFDDGRTQVGRCEKYWPPVEFHSAMAIAQHYGMSTRLLDWTWDPCVALYFAAKDALKISSEYFSVYALLSGFGGVRGLASSGFHSVLCDETKFKKRKEAGYQLMITPSFQNEYLKAQKGLFLVYVDRAFKANDKFLPTSIESEFSSENNNVIKFIINTKYAEDILRLLALRFYTASTLFPGYAGCIQSLLDKVVLGIDLI